MGLSEYLFLIFKVILPGGLEGSERLSKSEVVGKLLKEHEKAGKIVAAICAGKFIIYF